ncbi:MAG: sigma-54-dependent Fis family transcriptional regulator [Planctomycetes bacterium]|nr:sigma-54-dependent Fis family transcriptional regulator [Planctomycetota bacterium]
MTLRRIIALSRDPEVQQLAQKYGQEVFGADDLADALDIVQTVKPDLILFDHRFGTGHIREFLDRADKYSTNVPIVVVGDDDDNIDPATLGSIQNPPLAGSTEFMQAGAYDYLKGRQDYAGFEQIISRIKNESVSRDPCLVTRATSDERQATESSRFFAEDLACSVSMVGCSKATLDTLKMIKLVAASRCNPILILGETGTGKELAAKAIHILRHPNGQFVAVNCAALTANLLESELFGHVKGSFTGADREKTGLLELAESGTLLLDEISEMPLDLQAKLLRVLQEKCFRKVGGIKSIACNATIMASSNRNLKSEVQANRFRRDLYYRLNICPITLAPLRSQGRKQDIRLLTEYFLKTSTICPDKCGKITSLTELAIEVLEKHDWPGNVRELCNVIERAILLETTDKIGLNAIYIEPTEWNEVSNSTTPGLIKDFSLAKAECELIARALQKTGWQKTRAAALLGITRATLYAKVKQYNIEKDPYIADGPAKQEQNEVSSSLSQPVVAS